MAFSAALPAHAYVGPGAGFALLSSFLVVFTTILLAIGAMLILPFRILYRKIKLGRKPKARVGRLVVVGFDGMDPRVTERLLAEGKLPNLERLKSMGSYHRLRSTYPSITPVAWSSFATGVQPAKHNIFDFLARDPRTYLPVLSSTYIGSVHRFAKIGPWRIPLDKPALQLLRKAKPWWTILGERGIWSTILRVPITFPPDRFYGAELSAMSVPDLLGSQGTFFLFTTRPSDAKFKEGGVRVALSPEGSGHGSGRYVARLEGPENMFREGNPPLALPLSLEVSSDRKGARVKVGDEELTLELGVLSPWVPLVFEAAPLIKVHGICRMMPTELGEHVSLYVTPIHLDPEHPAMPISHPSYYSSYLANKIGGPFATLGLAEDTWALNEKVVDDATFLTQSLDIDRERQAMLFAGLDRLKKGALVCVFDATDRIQHMFWRYTEEGHPAAAHAHGEPRRDAIEELYKANDELVGRVLQKMRAGDLLVVCSDHGFTSFRRGVNLNAWLYQNGYLALKDGADGASEWLQDVDWSRTRAYAMGLVGMYLNVKGREAQGIVEPGDEARALKAEIVAKMSGLVDGETKQVGINEVFDTAKLYSGPYLDNAPDLLVGYNHGYRVSWDCATGMVSGPVFEDNIKAWSGDHCVDPRLVPGVLFCSHAIDDDDPALMDLAPTALTLFGLEPPKHMDGKTLFKAGPLASDPFAKKGKTPPASAKNPEPSPTQVGPTKTSPTKTAKGKKKR